jgi:hypothetical protein
MPLYTEIEDNGYSVLAADLLQRPEYTGKLIIVCWHHGNIPDLAMALSVSKKQIDDAQGMDGMHWDPAVFDLFWSIKFAGPAADLTITNQPKLS